jgi:hypothetical protein
MTELGQCWTRSSAFSNLLTTRDPPPRSVYAYPNKMEQDDVPFGAYVGDVRELPRPLINLQSRRREGLSPRYLEYFLPSEDINYAVIQNGICRHLGNDAIVRPSQHRDVGFHSPNGLKHPYSG